MSNSPHRTTAPSPRPSRPQNKEGISVWVKRDLAAKMKKKSEADHRSVANLSLTLLESFVKRNRCK